MLFTTSIETINNIFRTAFESHLGHAKSALCHMACVRLAIEAMQGVPGSKWVARDLQLRSRTERLVPDGLRVACN